MRRPLYGRRRSNPRILELAGGGVVLVHVGDDGTSSLSVASFDAVGPIDVVGVECRDRTQVPTDVGVSLGRQTGLGAEAHQLHFVGAGGVGVGEVTPETSVDARDVEAEGACLGALRDHY